MSEYLNKIGLLKYSNTTYKPIGQTQYYSVRDPQLVSSDPRIDYFSYPWKSDTHWSYNNFGSGWYYNGKDEIAYTLNKKNEELSCINPNTLSTIINSGFVYNVIPIHPLLLSRISGILTSSNLFNEIQQMFILSTTEDKIYKVEYDKDFRMVNTTDNVFTYTVIDVENGTSHSVDLSWKLSPELVDGNIHINKPAPVSGYWTVDKQISGVIFSYPYLGQGDIKDIYSNELQFKLESPNVKSEDVRLHFYDPSLPATEDNTNGFYKGFNPDNFTPIQSTMMYHPIDHPGDQERECLVWEKEGKIYVSWDENNLTHYYNPSIEDVTDPNFYLGYNLNLTPVQSTWFQPWSPLDNPNLPKKECLVWKDENDVTIVSYRICDLSTNITNGIFTNIPGTDYITGICTTKMYFVDDQYVYMRGLVKGNLDIQHGVLQNEIINPSTVIRKLKVTNLQGTLKNITELPDKLKYGLDHYYAWGWLYGIDNITYTNIWYKNEISGVLKPNKDLSYNGVLCTTISTNNGTEDISNIISGVFTKNNQVNIISGFMEGVIEPFNINMRGMLSGYYTEINNVLKPLQLSGVLYNKSEIDKNLRQILDIKYYNTLGRKGLSQPYSLYGQNLNYASKNYNPFDKPYMLETWKIIEYKISDQQIEIDTTNKENSIDLNTYITNKKYLKKQKSKRIQTNDEFDGSYGYYSLHWDKDMETGEFCIYSEHFDQLLINVSNRLLFKTQLDAQRYIKNLCNESNLKLKDYKLYNLEGNNQKKIITSYILDSSDLEIK